MAGLRTRQDHILDAWVSMLEEASEGEATPKPKEKRPPATALELLLFFLLLVGPVFTVLLLIFLTEGENFTVRKEELQPAIATEPATSTAPVATTDSATTTTSIEVVQPPTEVIEGAPVPAPEPASPAPPPEHEAPAPDTAPPPAPPHGG